MTTLEGMANTIREKKRGNIYVCSQCTQSILQPSKDALMESGWRIMPGKYGPEPMCPDCVKSWRLNIDGAKDRATS